MAGHSHSANIKHRKDRQDSNRSQLFLKLGKQIEQIIRANDGVITEKVLTIAQKNKLSKEKVFQIQERVIKEIKCKKGK